MGLYDHLCNSKEIVLKSYEIVGMKGAMESNGSSESLLKTVTVLMMDKSLIL